MAKLNLRDMSITYAAATFTSVTTASVAGLLWSHLGGQTDYTLLVSGTWLATVGLPSLLVSAETLRRKLGEKAGTTVTASPARGPGRSIPLLTNGQASHLFMSVLPGSRPEPEPLPTTFTATIDGNPHSVTIDDLEHFMRAVWSRQQRGEKHPFSRAYFTRQYRPRMHRVEYETRISVLLSVEGLILDRSERRSGKMSVRPRVARRALERDFLLV